jgi:hypothetical protein
MATKALDLEGKWLGKVARLNPASVRGQCRGKAPHKPLLLLSLIDMAEAGHCPAGRLVAWDRETGKPIEPNSP